MENSLVVAQKTYVECSWNLEIPFLSLPLKEVKNVFKQKLVHKRS